METVGRVSQVSIVPAKVGDALILEAFLKPFFRNGELLLIPEERLKRYLGRFLLAKQGSARILGSIGLFEWGRDLSEVRAFAVDPKFRGMGLGSALLERAVAKARALGKKGVFALTYKKEFFEAKGFREVAKESLPHKIWGDCILCPNRENCKEKAMLLDFEA